MFGFDFLHGDAWSTVQHGAASRAWRCDCVYDRCMIHDQCMLCTASCPIAQILESRSSRHPSNESVVPPTTRSPARPLLPRHRLRLLFATAFILHHLPSTAPQSSTVPRRRSGIAVVHLGYGNGYGYGYGYGERQCSVTGLAVANYVHGRRTTDSRVDTTSISCSCSCSCSSCCVVIRYDTDFVLRSRAYYMICLRCGLV